MGRWEANDDAGPTANDVDFGAALRAEFEKQRRYLIPRLFLINTVSLGTVAGIAFAAARLT